MVLLFQIKMEVFKKINRIETEGKKLKGSKTVPKIWKRVVRLELINKEKSIFGAQQKAIITSKRHGQLVSSPDSLLQLILCCTLQFVKML